MDEQEWLRRIDEHLETSKHYMREGNEVMARMDETMERNRVAFEDLREYLQQATTVLGALVAEIRADKEQSRDWRRESRAWRKETREWHRALLEKLDNGPQPSGA
ncbi:MAG: hypothetical protein QOE31_158 [Solirubrobacteraceae bacterium]|jgi:uncharacterized protein YaaN involved in tellurite resistance|nr:hypothetical protein [Solirubrobacteraceae bacterium]